MGTPFLFLTLSKRMSARRGEKVFLGKFAKDIISSTKRGVPSGP